MKKLFLGLCLLITIFALPSMTYASKQEVNMTLNNLTYSPKYTPLLINDTLYISGEDLATMTYGSFLENATSITLNIQNYSLVYDKTTKTTKLNKKSHTLRPGIYFTKDQTVYFPISLLDTLNYTYTYANYHFKLTTKMPYSTATDTYTSHHFYHNNAKTYQDLLAHLLSDEEVSTLVKETKKSNSYFSFITTADKQNCFRLIKDQVTTPKQMTLHMRNLKLVGDEPIISDFIDYNLTYHIEDDVIQIMLPNDTLSCNCFWATYNPQYNSIAIDLNKSLDVMLMRTFYEHYRNMYSIKDIDNITPITKITYDRSDYMTYPVFFEHDGKTVNCTVIIYRKATSSTVDYYIDLMV